MGKKELEWLSEHESDLESHSGKWIAFTAEEGILASGETVKQVMEEARRKHKVESPTVFLVPRKDEEAYVL